MQIAKYIKGLSLVVFVSIIAILLSNYVSVGSVTLAILLGILLGNTFLRSKNKSVYGAGIIFAEKNILAFAIALMGINLDFSLLSDLGLKTLFLIVIAMFVTIFSGKYIGKYFGLSSNLSLLLGIGNGVCGSSAIGASAKVLHSKEADIGVSVAVVNFLGTLGILIVPFLALFFSFSDIDSGILIGNTLQAVGQVTAGGFSISDVSGVTATTVKMGRVLLLTPLLFILLYINLKKNVVKKTENLKQVTILIVKSIPIFILFFILFSLVSSFSLVSENIKSIISTVSKIALIVAMSGVGLKIRLQDIRQDGKIAFLVGSLVFLVQIIFSGFLIYIFM